MKTRKLCPLCGGRMVVKHNDTSPYLSCEDCPLDYGRRWYFTEKDLIKSFEDAANNKRTLGRTRPKPVVKIDSKGNVLERYSSLCDAARKNPMSKTSIENRAKMRVKNEFDICDFSFRLEDEIKAKKGNA